MRIKKSINQIIKELKIQFGFKNDTDFADFLGIAPTTLSSWKSRNTIDYELIYAKCEGISADWLLTGEGSMLKTDTYNKVSPPPAAPSESNAPHECIYKEMLKEREAENKALNREIGKLQEQLEEAKKMSKRTVGTGSTVPRVENIPQLIPAEPASIP